MWNKPDKKPSVKGSQPIVNKLDIKMKFDRGFRSIKALTNSYIKSARSYSFNPGGAKRPKLQLRKVR